MRYLKQLADAVEAGTPGEISGALLQAKDYLTRVKSFEYQGEITIRFNGDINMHGVKSDLDDLMLLLADKKANDTFIGEIYVVVHKEDKPVESTALVVVPTPTPAKETTIPEANTVMVA